MNEVLAEILQAVNRIEHRLDKHMDEEEGEIALIMKVVQDNREESDRRHTALIDSINGYMSKQNDIERAFLLVDGARDYDGHHDDHKERKRFAEWKEDVKSRVLTKIMEWAGVALVIWIGLSLWESFLKGPQ